MGFDQEKQLIYTASKVFQRTPLSNITCGILEKAFSKPYRSWLNPVLSSHPSTSLAANRRNLPIDRQGNLTWHWQGAAAIAPATDNNSVTLRIEERTAAASKHFPRETN